MGQTHRSRFQKMRDDRVLARAERYAKWTLPQLMVDTAQPVSIERDYQEHGAILVNHCAAKLTSRVFPQDRPFFGLDLSEKAKERLKARGSMSGTQLQGELAKTEIQACEMLFRNSSYSQLIQLMKHLVVVGQSALYRDTDHHRTLTYGLRDFTLCRDGVGVVVDFVLREKTYFGSLDRPVRDKLLNSPHCRLKPSTPDLLEQEVSMYTRVCRVPKGDRWVYMESQEVEDVPVGKPSEHPEHLCPWIWPAWNLIIGEHYGRGLVEDHAGGFAKISDLSQALTLYGIEAMRLINLVSQSAAADIDALINAEVGEFVRGNPAGIQALEGGSDKKIAIIMQQIAETVQGLQRAFMYQANTRDAERVTRYELAQQAAETDVALGGIFSSISDSVSRLGRLLTVEVKPEYLEGLVTDLLQVDISTGLKTLGRSRSIQSLLDSAADGTTVIALTQLDKRVDPAKAMDVVYAAHAVDTEALLKSEEQLRQEAEADAQAAAGLKQAQAAATLAETQQSLNQVQ